MLSMKGKGDSGNTRQATSLVILEMAGEPLSWGQMLVQRILGVQAPWEGEAPPCASWSGMSSQSR